MNTKFLKTAIVMTVLVLTGLSAKAQVTIGSLNDPQKGVLLELKTKDAQNPTLVTDDENVTADETGGGLLFPRVKLSNKATLDPFINNSTATEKLTHAGMVVYNLSESNGFQLGLYVWNGAEWTKVQDGNTVPNKERWFMLPPFNIELVQGANTVNLYNEYKKQYDLKHNALLVTSNPALISPIGQVYAENELDYVLTYYDTRVMENVAINNGILTFNAKTLDLDVNSFINIIAVVK